MNAIVEQILEKQDELYRAETNAILSQIESTIEEVKLIPHAIHTVNKALDANDADGNPHWPVRVRAADTGLRTASVIAKIRADSHSAQLLANAPGTLQVQFVLTTDDALRMLTPQIAMPQVDVISINAQDVSVKTKRPRKRTQSVHTPRSSKVLHPSRKAHKRAVRPQRRKAR
jgi:hypothetical protein